MTERGIVRRAVVTGSASGMGQATTQCLLENGWEVLGLDIEALPNAPGLTSTRVDITQRQAVREAVAAFASTGEPLSLVANVAGIYPPSTLEDFTEELYRRTFDVNVLGVINVTAESMPYLASGSSVVNFASIDAFTVSPGQLLYGASKAAVVMLTKEMALELAPLGVRVNAIAPGWVDTPGNRTTDRMIAAAKSIPLGRVAAPEEIARWVLLLASGDAAYMTGETVMLSGGTVLR